MQQTEAMLQVLGINGLKAAAGSFVLNLGNFDSVTKTIVLAPAPAQGLLRIFSLPKVHLRPEPWVPATVASYQTYSWDLDNAYTAINDLVNMFQPGMLNVLEQQLVGPNGGEPLSFKKDIFDPLGDRVTLISDFKKPISEENQRMLLAVALEDSKTFQNTLNKLIALTGGTPKKREFQGTTIYDFEVPEVPNNNPNAPGGERQVQGPDQRDDRQGNAVPRERADPARAGPPRRRPRPGRQRRLPGRGQGDPRPGQHPVLRPPRGAGADLLRHGQERPVREGPRERGGRRRPRHVEDLPSSSTRRSCPTSRSSPSISR